MAKTDPSLVVADAGPLIHLDELDALDVLSDFTVVFVPEAVWIEVQRHRPQVFRQTGINLIKQPPPSVSAEINALTALYTLHRGEREALSLCITHAASLFITDDTAARLLKI
jgi:predicted nucleic acid-binding protein